MVKISCVSCKSLMVTQDKSLIPKGSLLAEVVSCPNADKNCYYLNELLAPCDYKIDFSYIYYYFSVGGDNFSGLENCSCTKEFYDTLVTCGKFCQFPVDTTVKYESDCKIAKHPVDLSGGWYIGGHASKTGSSSGGTQNIRYTVS
ncbi:10850_t:CDS:2 [Rhizophagus irregularis]|nr:10850_t:CDS:2 [Rhizophagus irregularis]